MMRSHCQLRVAASIVTVLFETKWKFKFSMTFSHHNLFVNNVLFRLKTFSMFQSPSNKICKSACVFLCKQYFSEWVSEGENCVRTSVLSRVYHEFYAGMHSHEYFLDRGSYSRAVLLFIPPSEKKLQQNYLFTRWFVWAWPCGCCRAVLSFSFYAWQFIDCCEKL